MTTRIPALVLIALVALAPAGFAQTSEEEFAKAIFFGKRFFELGDFAGAYAQYARAEQIQPDHPGLLYNLALTLARLGRFGEAQGRVDRYRQLHPAGAESPLVSRLAMELDFQRELERKRQAAQGYVELFNRGTFLYARGSHQEALSVFAEAEQMRPDDAAVAYNQALAYEALGDLQKATERYRRYVELARNPGDKSAVDQKIFALETEIENIRTSKLCPFCGARLAQNATWCHRSWHGPLLGTSPRLNSRICGEGATAVRSIFYNDGRLAKNEDLPCTLREKLSDSLRYQPGKQQGIQAARQAEGWTYSGEIITGRTTRAGDQLELEQRDYLEHVRDLTSGNVDSYTAQKAGETAWQLETEELDVEGQKFSKRYSYLPDGTIAQETVSYHHNSCGAMTTVTADYTYQNGELSSVRFKASSEGARPEGLPLSSWEGTLAFFYDEGARVIREDFVVTAFTRTYREKPAGEFRDEVGKLHPGWRVDKPVNILTRGDLCRLDGTTLVANHIDLRPFYTISPSITTLLPPGATKMTVTYTYPEGFRVR